MGILTDLSEVGTPSWMVGPIPGTFVALVLFSLMESEGGNKEQEYLILAIDFHLFFLSLEKSNLF